MDLTIRCSMRRTRRDIEKIIEQTNELVAQQKELQEQRNQCKSIYESLLLDRKIDSIKSQIFDLDKDKDALFSILLKGPTRYIVDTDVWFYSDFISRYAFAKTPFDQLGFHLIYWLVLRKVLDLLLELISFRKLPCFRKNPSSVWNLKLSLESQKSVLKMLFEHQYCSRLPV